MAIEDDVRQVLAELLLVSHVSAASMDSSSRDAGEDIGGRKPPGGIDRKGDHETDYPQKSIDYFRKRLRRAHSDYQLEGILKEARDSLKACRRQPAPSDEPEYGSPQWKRWVAESDLSAGEIARKFNVSRQYVHSIRAKYRLVP